MYKKRHSWLKAQGSGTKNAQGTTAGTRLIYVGHTGTGFDERELQRVSKLLKARAIARSPFANPIKSNETAHWVTPDLVAQVRFTEWTDDEKLRHPVYQGLRDDKDAKSVVGETACSGGNRSACMLKKADKQAPTAPKALQNSLSSMQPVVDQLQALEDARRDGAISLPDGSRMSVTNLAKLFWPKLKLTKGNLLRYYASVAPFLLPVVADRPLVMKRFPNGVDDPVAFSRRRKQRNGRPLACASKCCPLTSIPSTSPAPSDSSAARSSRCST